MSALTLKLAAKAAIQTIKSIPYQIQSVRNTYYGHLRVSKYLRRIKQEDEEKNDMGTLTSSAKFYTGMLATDSPTTEDNVARILDLVASPDTEVVDIFNKRA